MVVATAIEMADRDGLAALTMRRLADELGVGAMTAYHYFPSKDRLLLALIEAVLTEIPLPRDDGWRPQIRQLAFDTYHTLRRHPWAARAMLALPEPTPGRLAHMERMLGALERAGLSPDDADDAFHALEAHVMGFSLWEVGMDLGEPEDVAELAARFLEQLPHDRYPSVAAHIEHHVTTQRARSDGAFGLTLDAILDRIEQLPGAR